MSSDVVVKLENVSKKFCRDLKQSLRYGVRDVVGELFCRDATKENLRPSEFWALRDISFELRQGECLGLIGRNGAGKTTLLKLLSGLIKPDQGRIRVRGRVGALIELGAGFSPILTGRENIYVNAAVLGMPKRQVDSIIDEIIDFAEIGEFIDTPVQSYSSGMRVRLGYAIAAHFNPDILLLDEVLAVGDLAFQQKCLQNMKNRITNGSAILFVSHNIRIVQFICNRILFLDNGRIAALGSPTEVAEEYLNSIAKHQTKDKPTNAQHETPTLSGTGVTVNSVQLFDSDGMRNSEFKTGGKLQFEVVVNAERSIQQPSLGATVWTQDGIKVATLSSHFLAFQISEIRGEKRFRCVIEPLNLMPGRYILRGGIYDSFAGFPYYQWGWEDHLLEFTVVSGRSMDGSLVFYDGLGVVKMEFQWHEVTGAL